MRLKYYKPGNFYEAHCSDTPTHLYVGVDDGTYTVTFINYYTRKNLNGPYSADYATLDEAWDAAQRLWKVWSPHPLQAPIAWTLYDQLIRLGAWLERRSWVLWMAWTFVIVMAGAAYGLWTAL